MPRLSPISSKKLSVILVNLRFIKVRQEGSHARYEHLDGRRITIPMHSGENVHKGLLRKIIRDLGISPEEFRKLK